MEKFRVYGVSTKEESQRELEHRALARRAAADGMVLLKNDGILPLTNRKIALYGVGARMTGAGFGGCTVNLVKEDQVEGFISAVGPRYTRRTGLEPEFFVVSAADGAQEVTDPRELAANEPVKWGVEL